MLHTNTTKANAPSNASAQPPAQTRAGVWAAKLRKLLLIVLVVYVVPPGCMLARHWSDDSPNRYTRKSTGLAPGIEEADAIIQVYSARAARWRGALGVHTWFALRRSDETRYTRVEVMGYMRYWGGSAVRIWHRAPDAFWFGNKPTLLREIRGVGADGNQRVDDMIDTIIATAEAYRYDDQYRVWPGPNSNTFIATVARAVPMLRLELPPNAVGKDFLAGGRLLDRTPSGLGLQLSLGGALGVMLGLEEGIEVNLLGMSAGIDFYPPALKLPAIGRIGFPDQRRKIIGDVTPVELPVPPPDTATAETPGARP